MELALESLCSSTRESALDGGRHIGEHHTKNNIVTIGFSPLQKSGNGMKERPVPVNVDTEEFGRINRAVIPLTGHRSC